MENGKIVIINGTSSSGKTTLLKAFQDRMNEPYLEAGIDKFIWMLPKRYLDRPLWDDVLGKAIYAGETGNRLVSGMHRSMAALSQAGLNVVADHVLVMDAWARDCIEQFSSLPAYLIGLTCPLKVLEEREKSRKDRTLGQARLQFDVIHKYVTYDVMVDTSRLTPIECADEMINRLKSPPEAFQRMKRQMI